jgi:hypothetical protein
MADIKQSIDIKANIDGLEKIRQGTADLEDLKSATEAISDAEVQADIPMSNVSAMRNQLNTVRQMHIITKNMMTDMKRGEFVGTKEHVKGLDESLKRLKKMSNMLDGMSDDAEDVNDNLKDLPTDGRPRGAGARAGVTGGAMGLTGRFQAVGGALAGGDILTGAMTGVTQAGGAVRDVGQQRGGRFGAGLQKAGLWGMIAGGVLAGAYGIDKLLYGAFENLAPQGFQFERLMGRAISNVDQTGVSPYRKLMLDAEKNILDRSDVLQAMGVVRARSGAGTMGSAQNIMDLMKVGLSPEMAGGIMAMERRFGGTMDARQFIKLASQGGYAQRIDEFGRNVQQLTDSLQNVGVDIGSEAGAEIVSQLGRRYGETFRGTGGATAMMGMHQAIQGAMGLQSPAQAMMFRALWRGNFRDTMMAMEEGISNPENLRMMISHLQRTMPSDIEGQARVLEQWGIKGYRQRLRMLGADLPTRGALPEIERERRTREELGVTEFGRARQAGLPLELVSRAGYATKLRNYIRELVRGREQQQAPRMTPEQQRQWEEEQFQQIQDPDIRAEYERIMAEEMTKANPMQPVLAMETAMRKIAEQRGIDVSDIITEEERIKQEARGVGRVGGVVQPQAGVGEAGAVPIQIPEMLQGINVHNEIIIQNNTEATVEHKSGSGEVIVK